MTSGLSSMSIQPGNAPDVAQNTGEELELLTVSEVAALLKVSKSWVYERTRSQQGHEHALPFVKLGTYLRFDERDIRAYIDQQRKAVHLRHSR